MPKFWYLFHNWTQSVPWMDKGWLVMLGGVEVCIPYSMYFKLAASH